MSRSPVAIVGRACVLPGALTPEALWSRVRAGEDLTSRAPDGRWGMPPWMGLAADPARSVDRAWSDRGGYVEGFDEVFDPTGLHVPPEELLGLDPLVRWVVHTARTALEGVGGDRARTGLILGNLSFPSEGLARHAAKVWADRAAPGLAARLGVQGADPRDRFMSGLPALIAARALGLGGAAFCLDAACASALYALAIGVDRLEDGELDTVLVGAVNRADDLFLHVGFCALQALSRTGRSRPFHAGADGLLPAEGCVVLALRRLEDARADGDTVLGIVRGVGLSNDGRGGGILAPSREGQVRALRAAWEASGLSPRDVGLVECHATGTPVGDAVELASMAEVFDGDDVPIGSIKANLGHPITVAGGAGLLKVLAALEHRERPPTPGIDHLTPALTDSRLRLVQELEPWTGPAVAAVSAFGFGGNNAHVVITGPDVEPPPTAPAPRREVAVVSLGARLPGGGVDVIEALSRGERTPARRLDEFEVVLDGLRTPPADLQQTLPQQLAILEAARDAVDGIDLPTARTGVLVGMGADPEVARWGARWRLASWSGLTDGPLAAARDAVVPALTSAGVVGTMPNIPANRIQTVLDLGGPGFTVSSEELSGVDALRIAVRAVATGRLDAAVVGAVDLCCEPVHEAAAQAVGLEEPAADAAVAMVLMPLEQAWEAGLPVLAVVGQGDGAGAPEVRHEVLVGLGRAHAASGLLEVAVAIASLHEDRADGEEREVSVRSKAMGGREDGVSLEATGPADPLPGPAVREGRRLTVPAHWTPVDLRPLVDPAVTVLPPAPWLPRIMPAEADIRVRAPVAAGGVVAPAPALRAPPPPVAAAPPPPSAPTTAPAPAPAVPGVLPVPPADARAQLAAAHLATVSAAHADHLRRLAEVHQAFLARQQRMTALALAARGGAAIAAHPGAPPASRDAVVVAAPQVVPAAPARAPVAASPPARVPSPPVVAVPSAPAVPPRPVEAAPSVAWVRVPASSLPGPKLDRAGLEVHASGRISEIFGEAFAGQDGFRRQVRMPEPPLLLADRLLGIDAPAGELGRGVLWTETDVGSQPWLLHEGRMPAGILIESGQADLMLISWMGIDRFNRSERVYRLLGCELTYERGLPEAGTTLRYEIHVDGHAVHDGIRLFFFHYDCVDDQGRKVLTVRGGQAGFFTDGELEESAGVLWSPETGEHDATARLDAPAVACTKGSLTGEELQAFSRGDAHACFGPGFEKAASHVATPRIQADRMLLLHRVDVLDPRGGPWGRGYLKATWDVRPDDWFFAGHFKNDPCMPGTLMFEGCLQALAIYLTSLGYTLPRDGWRFEPVPGEPIPMRCRGQVLPGERTLTYEVFVEEVHDGPVPMVYADLLCTVDGLKAFHARRCGLRLAPHWPLDDKLGPADLADPPGARIASVDGFAFDKRAMLACAWGRPSEAFGPMYAPFDGDRRVPRLPSPPYHFVSRVEEVEGPLGGMKAGTRCLAAYDVPPDAWYFDDGATGAMPYAVLLEVALQPCGWLASYVGSALTSSGELFFRNLDGTGTLHREVLPDVGTILTAVTLTKLSQSGGMIICAFEVRCTDRHGAPIWTMDTVFGFFPAAALDAQRGLGPDVDAEAAWAAPGDGEILLREEARRFRGASARLGGGRLALLDRLTGLWPEGGKAGLGRVRGRMDVHPRLWFFSAHFFQDPVQPGSLGLEAIEQGLRALLIAKGLATDGQRFQSLAVEVPVTWRYRGQVRPHNTSMDVVVDLVELREEEGGLVAVADADLWCDGLRIYRASGMAVRVLPVEPTDREPGRRRVSLTTEPWLTDHRPTFTAPAIPMMDLAAFVLRSAPGAVGLRGLELTRWHTVGEELLATVVVDGAQGTLTVGSVASRVELLFSAPAESPWADVPGESIADPYGDGRLFHGPAYQLVRELQLGAEGAQAWIDLDALSVPEGARLGVVLDALTHLVPHDGLTLWNPQLDATQVAFPLRLDHLVVHGPLPATGRLRARARFDGMVDARRPAVRLQLCRGEVVLAEARLVEILVPKGPIGSAPRAARLRFLRDRRWAGGVGLSQAEDGGVLLRKADVAASDWLPGTVEALYGAPASDPVALAAKDCAAAALEVHPGAVELAPDGLTASSTRAPMSVVSLDVRAAKTQVRVRGTAHLDLAHLEEDWRGWFGIGAWPVEDLYYSLLERFVRRVHTPEPEALEAFRGRPVLYLANHQTMVESLLFSILAGGLLDLPVCTVAKDEHRTSWLGRLIRQSFAWPGVTDPRVIAFLDRGDKTALLTLLAELQVDLAAGRRSVMIHVEGTRALSSTEPVVKLSGAVLDLAIAADVPVVPVRFVGGLPVEPLVDRTDYPVGLGAQDVWIGAPILPATLAADDLRTRKLRVLQALEALGPPRTEEQALPGDPALEAAVAARVAAGAPASLAVATEVLARSPRRASAWTDRLLAAVAGDVSEGDAPEAAWVAEMAALLAGRDHEA